MSLPESGPFISCANAACAAWFLLVNARDYPWLCLDHADEARRVGLLCWDRGGAGTVWYAPKSPSEVRDHHRA